MNTKDPIEILVVEDDPVTAAGICETLNSRFYHCHHTVSLAGAGEIIKEKVINLVICDLNLPDGHGFDFLRQIRRTDKNTAFIVITSSDDPGLITTALRSGANDFISKPFHLHNLPTIIQRNLERQHMERLHDHQIKIHGLTEAIRVLIAALEAKDSYTSGHSVRVARYAMMLGHALSFNEDDLFTLELSAILHDIGKIGMPDQILKKSSSLLEKEYRTAKEHPVIGSKIVGKIGALKEVALIIRNHHERFDGNGYPDQLSGYAIPLMSRILTIADAYESIVSNRIYREKKTPEVALDELKKNAGTQFDPALVKLFIQIQSDTSLKKPVLRIDSQLHNLTAD